MFEELATLRFVEERSNVLLIGQPGVGKTMLAIALGLKAVDAGHRIYYTTAAELGYLPMMGEAAAHLFQVISHRYEKGLIVLTTNRGIASWVNLRNTTVAAAILDRLLHRASVLHIDGESYRMRGHREKLKGLWEGVARVGKFRDRKWGIFVILDTVTWKPRPSPSCPPARPAWRAKTKTSCKTSIPPPGLRRQRAPARATSNTPASRRGE